MSQESFHGLLHPVKADDGTVGLGTFFRTALEWLRTGAHNAIDTEEERDELLEFVLKQADIFVAPKFPAVWPVVRMGLQTMLDGAMDVLPSLI